MIYIETDETYRNAIIYENKKRKVIKKRFRLTMIHTGYKNPTVKRKEITNKRILITAVNEKTKINSEEYWLSVKKFITCNYEKSAEAKWFVIGDGAKYIVNSEIFIDASFIIDRFHIQQALTKVFKRKDIISRWSYLRLKSFLEHREFDNFFSCLISYQEKQTDWCLLERVEKLKKYITNYQRYIERHDNSDFIGCPIEGYISHYIKVMFRVKPKIFNEKTITKILLIKQFIFNGTDIFLKIKEGNYPRMYLWRKEMRLNEFNNSFQTEKHCLKYIASLKLMKCIKCGSTCLNVSDFRKMRCLQCNQTFSILHGTIFYKSQTQLTSWFYLIFRWMNTKHGIPATDVAKELGVTYKTAWRMGHEIRNRIAKQTPQLIVTGIPQMDEMYLSHMGSKQQGRSLLNKTLIVGIYEKTTNTLIVKVLKKADKKNLLKFALQHISVSCPLFTDSWSGYKSFKTFYPKHETVNHQFGYVSSTGVNTNQIESVWKHLRKTFRTHVRVSKENVHLYAKEAAYKFNKLLTFETVMLCML